jgi:voltage-gated potassium channel
MVPAPPARRARPPLRWGLVAAPSHSGPAQRAERAWRWPTVIALLATVPAFYLELLHAQRSPLSIGAYLLAAGLVLGSLLHVGWRSGQLGRHALANPADLMLVAGLLASAALPGSQGSVPALAVRLAVAFLTLLRMVWGLQHLVTRGGLTYLLLASAGVLGACGLGFWWLEPSTPTLFDGLWLAFTTAATVGYGDVVPTTPAAKIFSVFVVLLGFGVLSLVTAAIAAHWVQTEERAVERDILHDLRAEMARVHRELADLRQALTPERPRAPDPESDP